MRRRGAIRNICRRTSRRSFRPGGGGDPATTGGALARRSTLFGCCHGSPRASSRPSAGVVFAPALFGHRHFGPQAIIDELPVFLIAGDRSLARFLAERRKDLL